jgi:hypothetical protein
MKQEINIFIMNKLVHDAQLHNNGRAIFKARAASLRKEAISLELQAQRKAVLSKEAVDALKASLFDIMLHTTTGRFLKIATPYWHEMKYL